MQIEHTVLFGAVTTFAAICAIFGGVIARDRSLQNQIVSGDRASREQLDKEVRDMDVKLEQIHHRINATRDDFVRRDDLRTHMEQVEQRLKQMYDSQQGTNTRIDKMLDRMTTSDDRRTK